jgi:tRNA G10  N-methylase Trm11
MNKVEACGYLIPGKYLLQDRPGRPVLYPRIADEAFLRAVKYNATPEQYNLYDPFCGIGGALTSPAVLHRQRIAGVFGSDTDTQSLAIAGGNLNLCSVSGLDAAHGTLDAAKVNVFQGMLAHYGCQTPLPARLFVHSMPSPVPADAIAPETIDMVITDPPYGHMTAFQGAEDQPPVPEHLLFERYVDSLRALRPLLRDKATVTMICDKRQELAELLGAIPEYDYREGRASKGKNFRKLHTLQAK